MLTNMNSHSMKGVLMKSQKSSKIHVFGGALKGSAFYVLRTRKKSWIWVGSNLTPTQIALSARIVCTPDEIQFLDEHAKGRGI